jgi:hypothetical protein
LIPRPRDLLADALKYFARCGNEPFNIPLLLEAAEKARLAIGETVRRKFKLLCQRFSMNRELFQ